MRTQLLVDRGNLQIGESRPTPAMKIPPKFGCSSLASLSSSARRCNLWCQRGSPGGRQGWCACRCKRRWNSPGRIKGQVNLKNVLDVEQRHQGQKPELLTWSGPRDVVITGWPTRQSTCQSKPMQLPGQCQFRSAEEGRGKGKNKLPEGSADLRTL